MGQPIIKHPIYIVSKGRHDRCLFARYLLNESIPFKIAVEPQEYDLYNENFSKEYLFKLPFSNLGQGSYPARNACWEDAILRGAEKHFIFDDNIYGFSNFEKGLRHNSKTPIARLALYTLQAFAERYKNLPLAGYNYRYFAGRWTTKPFFLNSHVYSGMLIQNDIKPRWRLKYNEDVDLSLQILHGRKNCTILLNTFLINKVSTVSKMKGGNQTELYKDNDPLKKALKASSIAKVWPQYAKTVMKYGRPHHSVSWNKHFNQPLIRVDNYDELIRGQALVLDAISTRQEFDHTTTIPSLQSQSEIIQAKTERPLV